jgi:hypothetical protein
MLMLTTLLGVYCRAPLAPTSTLIVEAADANAGARARRKVRDASIIEGGGCGKGERTIEAFYNKVDRVYLLIVDRRR